MLCLRLGDGRLQFRLCVVVLRLGLFQMQHPFQQLVFQRSQMSLEGLRLELQILKLLGVVDASAIECVLIAVDLGFLRGNFLFSGVCLGACGHQFGLGLVDGGLRSVDTLGFRQDGVDLILPRIDLVQAKIDLLQGIQTAGAAHGLIIEGEEVREQPYIWRKWMARSTITIVKSRTEWLLVGLASAGVALITFVPYTVAADLVPDGRLFSGFLINPVDGYSYLAKMQQGMAGAWGFTLPYAGMPSGSAAIFLFYLGLGHLAAVLHTAPLGVYHAARIVGGMLMFLSVYFLLKAILPEGLPRLIAFSFVLVGSGLGWLGLAAGLQGSDLLVPESIPFVTAFTNPHFPAALALVAIGARLIVGDDGWRMRLGVGVPVGMGLGIVLPFAAVPLVAAGGAWCVWEGLRRQPSDGSRLLRQPGSLATLAIALGAAPWLAYDFWVVTAKPVFAAWNAQNLTPSPSVVDYLVGFGILLIWAAYAVWRGDVPNGQHLRFLVTWVVVNSLLLYAPVGIQRRFSLGLFLPLACLAGIGVAGLVRRSARRGWLLFALSFLMSLPSNGLVVAAGLATAASGSPLVTETAAEARGYNWLAVHADPGAVVLASPDTGVRLPAYASIKVVAGHDLETPQADARIRQLAAMFDGSLTADAAGALLEDWNVTYVFYGPREQGQGQRPVWLTVLQPVFESADVTIYTRGGP